ncbi:MAG: hypothetical protein IT379_37180 [Deltaproteobacteria bacterium]|nr:hypothetical protein [Deltaproteobacteria bacterium]
MSEGLPRRPGLSAARALLDEAMIQLRAVEDPGVPTREVESALADALRHVYQAMASTDDYGAWQHERSTALDGARQALALLQEHLGDDPGTLQDVTLVAQALAVLNEAAPSLLEPKLALPRTDSAEPPPVLRASVGVPTLLDVRRAILYPAVLLRDLPEPLVVPEPDPPPPPPIETEEELDALAARNAAKLAAFLEALDAPPTAALGPPPPAPLAPLPDDVTEREIFGERLEKDEVVWQWSRTAFEDLAMLGLQRVPLEGGGDTWESRAVAETRLLRRVDAIVAAGDAFFPRLVKLIEDRPVVDPDLVWAGIFFFGSLAGDDAADEVFRLARCAPLDDDDVRERVTDALSLAPHPGIDSRLAEWLGAAAEPQRTIAVAALARRGTLVLEQAIAATADPERRVVAAAARALGYVPGTVPPHVLTDLFARPESDIVQAALESSMLLHRGEGLRAMERLVYEGRGGFARSAVFLSLWAGAEHGTALTDAAAADPSPVFLRALGWYGNVASIPLLVSKLPSDDPALAGAAVEALFRITGAWLTDDVPDPAYPENGLPFKRAFVAPPVPVEMTLDPAVWEAWWSKHGSRARRENRYRWGQEWSFQSNLWELEQPEASRRNRWLSHLELTARSGRSVRFRTEDFVPVQRQRLAEWREAIDDGRMNGSLARWPSRLG